MYLITGQGIGNKPNMAEDKMVRAAYRQTGKGEDAFFVGFTAGHGFIALVLHGYSHIGEAFSFAVLYNAGGYSSIYLCMHLYCACCNQKHAGRPDQLFWLINNCIHTITV